MVRVGVGGWWVRLEAGHTSVVVVVVAVAAMVVVVVVSTVVVASCIKERVAGQR